MAKVNIPEEKRAQIFALAYERADSFGYATRNRPDNGMFMNNLVNDPEIGGVLAQFMPQEAVKTYIKDTILNHYTKDLVKRKSAAIEPVAVFQTVFGVDTLFVGEKKPVAVCRGADNEVYVLSVGTYLKWETALRKALEHIASMESIHKDHVHICLGLVVINDDITIGDKRHIEAALDLIGAKVYFVG